MLLGDVGEVALGSDGVRRHVDAGDQCAPALGPMKPRKQ
jgi:hypothetical protein